MSKEHRVCIRMRLEYGNMGVCNRAGENCRTLFLLFANIINIFYHYFLSYYLLINKAKGFKTKSVVFKLQ